MKSSLEATLSLDSGSRTTRFALTVDVPLDVMLGGSSFRGDRLLGSNQCLGDRASKSVEQVSPIGSDLRRVSQHFLCMAQVCIESGQLFRLPTKLGVQ